MHIPRMVRYPIEAIIIEGFDSHRIKHDKITRIIDKDSGHEYYKFKKAKGEYKPLPYDKIIPSDKGLTALLFSPASGQYFLIDVEIPMIEKDVKVSTFENNELKETTVHVTVPVIKPINESIRQAASVNHHRLDMRYQKKSSFWDKYGTIITVIFIGLAFAIPAMFYPMYFSVIADKTAGMINQLTEVMKQVGIATQGLSTSIPTSPPPV